jgi:hypothetical protein
MSIDEVKGAAENAYPSKAVLGFLILDPPLKVSYSNVAVEIDIVDEEAKSAHIRETDEWISLNDLRTLTH